MEWIPPEYIEYPPVCAAPLSVPRWGEPVPLQPTVLLEGLQQRCLVLIHAAGLPRTRGKQSKQSSHQPVPTLVAASRKGSGNPERSLIDWPMTWQQRVEGPRITRMKRHRKYERVPERVELSPVCVTSSTTGR